MWEHDGIICTGETYKNYVKLTFPRAPRCRTRRASSTPASKATRRAIDIREGEAIDEKAFKALIRAAVALNVSKKAAARPARAEKGSGSG